MTSAIADLTISGGVEDTGLGSEVYIGHEQAHVPKHPLN